MLREILVLDRCANDALAAASLHAVLLDGQPFDVSTVRDRYGDLFDRRQLRDVQFTDFTLDEGCAAAGRVLFFDVHRLVAAAFLKDEILEAYERYLDEQRNKNN